MRKYQAKPKKRIFGWVLLGYTVLLVLAVVFCVLYVRGLLEEYERRLPERQVELVLRDIKQKAEDPEAFCKTFGIDDITLCEYEEGIDVLSDYFELLCDPETDFALKPGSLVEDEMRYVIRYGKTELAQVLLKAKGPAETKLAVFSMRDWAVTEVLAGPRVRNYTLTLPEDFSLRVNGMVCKDAVPTDKGELVYALDGFYFEPELEITSPDGKKAEYVIRGERILPEIYSYTLVLPRSLRVTLNSLPCVGENKDDGYVSYTIRELKKPDVIISDLYGNTISYDGGTVSVTSMTILADDGYSISVNSAAVPDEAIVRTVPKQYKIIEDVVDSLPMNMEYDIAFLGGDAIVEVKDSDGNAVALEEGKSYYDLTSYKGSDTVPDEISDSIDVLDVAQKWSLYMSNDYSFTNMAAYMLPDSYQYEVAYKYSQSTDRTFFSGHVLLDPAFTDSTVSNFVMITEDCFSVDISFVKHMRLNSNQVVDDAMNDSFYFVRSNGKWLLAGMQEVSDNA